MDFSSGNADSGLIGDSGIGFYQKWPPWIIIIIIVIVYFLFYFSFRKKELFRFIFSRIFNWKSTDTQTDTRHGTQSRARLKYVVQSYESNIFPLITRDIDHIKNSI